MELLTRNNFESWMQKLMERSEEDVLTFLSGHVKDFKKEDIAFYKARIHNFFQK